MPRTAIARIRRFNRAVTQETGALDHSFLGRGRPLGAARVLTAIPATGGKLAALRKDLSLDPGLLSRLLTSLEREGLITLLVDARDKRKRTARLTTTGQAECAAYDALSDTRAAALLSGRASDAVLLDAMDRVTCTLGRARAKTVTIDPESQTAQDSLAGYYSELNTRFDTGFDVAASRDPDPDTLRAPNGAFLSLQIDGAAFGCAALKHDASNQTVELKRFWIAPPARGLGLARLLLADCETTARVLGAHALRLDTNRTLTEAIALYRSSGYREIPAYSDEPYAHHWFEKPL